MMLASFIARYHGQAVDVDHAYGPQCVDLVNRYLADVRQARPMSGNAIDLRGQLAAGARWVPNSAINYPSPGDVAVWGIAPYGHVAVVVTADPTALVSFDQNWGGVVSARLVIHTYEHVVGWQHFS